MTRDFVNQPVVNQPKDSTDYFENNGYTELKYRPSAWIRYTDQGE